MNTNYSEKYCELSDLYAKLNQQLQKIKEANERNVKKLESLTEEHEWLKKSNKENLEYIHFLDNSPEMDDMYAAHGKLTDLKVNLHTLWCNFHNKSISEIKDTIAKLAEIKTYDSKKTQ
ncbi:hypothetical protein [Fluviispira vulneris]|uniref:hypothetical protein n=1 Tax=Fluviispira vulneris TaxID=2763012 RepID=UPI0016465D5A|nr:hypothetical protein [Fluviispira vulneris]